MDRDSIKQIITPTLAQAAVCLLLSVTLFVVTYGGVLVSHFSGEGLLGDPYFNQSYSIFLTRLSSFKAVDFMVKAVFWAGVGFIAYMVYLGISNVLIEARNEIVIEAAYTNKADLPHRLSKTVMQLTVSVVLFAALLITGFLMLPTWLKLFEGFIFNWPDTLSLIALFAAVAGASLNIYLLWTLGQIVFGID